VRPVRWRSAVITPFGIADRGPSAAALAWLTTDEGEALLAAARALPPDRLTRISRLRRLAPSQEIAAAAVALLELRERARSRFADAAAMLFTAEGLEQATGDRIAAYRAGRYPAGAAILDACCGIGGDARQLALRGPVLAVDRDPAAALCAAFNGRAKVVCADTMALSLERLAARGVRFALFDPSRRTTAPDGTRRRVRSGDDYSPALSWMEALKEWFEGVSVKVSPAIDDAALAASAADVEFISDRGECKEAVLWLGALARPLAAPHSAGEPYYATVLGAGGEPHTLAPLPAGPAPCSEIRSVLYEPDAAVIRAHRVPQLAELLSASRLDPDSPFLTADRHVQTPFAAAFRVIDALPFQERNVQRRLRALGARVEAVKKRGVPYEPAAVQRALDPSGDRAVVLILMRLAGRVMAILCERFERA